MEYYFFVAIGILIAFFCAVSIIFGTFNFFIEPLYMMIFKRPILVHLYFSLLEISPSQRLLLASEFKFYRRLNDKQKRYFEHRIAKFIRNCNFIGKGGLMVTDEMRLLIAATYVMLTFGMRHYITSVFDKILIYPDAYFSTINQELHHGEFNPKYKAIVFSWKHFLSGHKIDTNNINLGIHEFAHALHYHGARKRDNSAAMFADGYAKILKEVKHPPNARMLINSGYFRSYAFNNDFEFLAVILEHYFETPDEFRTEFPILFGHVQRMINLKPV